VAMLAPSDDMQETHIEYVLQSVDGNKARAGEIPQISRSSLYRILQESSDSSQNASVMFSLKNRPLHPECPFER
jgi:DNA-binding NtrC family response regulator